MIDSVYRKDENCYPKVSLESYNFNDYVEICSDEEYSDDSDDKIQISKIKCIDLYLEKDKLTNQQSSRNANQLFKGNISKFFKLRATKFHFSIYKKFFESVFFYFLSSESLLLNFFQLGARNFVFTKYKKSVFLKKI